MGRVFEKRKHKMFARFDKMAKGFTRIGKDIAIAIKQGGPNPDNNPRLRMAIQNAKGLNMPKDRVDAAIKRASSKEEKDFQEVIYEGYAPHGVPVLVECASDNPTRTVANLRATLNKGGGSMGTQGMHDFIFDRKGVFKISAANIDAEELEFELIDAGLDSLENDEENHLILYSKFADFGSLQKALEDKNIGVLNAELQRIPTIHKELNEEQTDDVLELIDKLEQDDDVQTVFHNLA